MKHIKISSPLSKEDLLEVLRNQDEVNKNVTFDQSKGKPVILVNEKGGCVNMTCKMVGGPSKDNGFIVGTFFKGRFKEKNGSTTLSGYIMTAPLYHIAMLILTALFIYRCISLGGFSPVPVILIVFSYFLFKNEYKKQGIIERYIKRAFRKAVENKKQDR